MAKSLKAFDLTYAWSGRCGTQRLSSLPAAPLMQETRMDADKNGNNLSTRTRRQTRFPKADTSVGSTASTYTLAKICERGVAYREALQQLHQKSWPAQVLS